MAMAIHNAIFALVASSFLVAFSSAHEKAMHGRKKKKKKNKKKKTNHSMLPCSHFCLFFFFFCFYLTDFVRFGYSGSTGPQNWGSLSSEFSQCTKGSHQSPINIVKDDAVYNANLGSLHRDYVAANATLINNGFNVALRFDGAAGTLVVDGKNYTLRSILWHSPSEHTFDGERFPVELQLIHTNSEGNIAAVAILYRYGSPDSFLFQLKDKLAELAHVSCSEDEEAQVSVGGARTRSFKRRSKKYFRYVGSLTTPPCTENVVWTVLGKVRELSQEQANLIRAPLAAEFKNNSRPTQPLNGRTVEFFDEARYYGSKSH